MSSEREIDVRPVNLFQIDVFTDRTIEFDLLFICQFCFRSPIVYQWLISSRCSNCLHTQTYFIMFERFAQ